MLVTVGGSTPCRRAPKHHTVCSALRHSMTWWLLCLQPHSQSSYFSASSGQTTKNVDVKCQWSLFFHRAYGSSYGSCGGRTQPGMHEKRVVDKHVGTRTDTITSWKYCSKLSTRLSKLAYVRIKHHSNIEQSLPFFLTNASRVPKLACSHRIRLIWQR